MRDIEAHMIGTKFYVAYHLNYFKHMDMQVVHCNDYYANIVLSIARPLEVLTVIYNKMDRAKTTSPCFAHRIKASNGIFKLHVLVICNMVLSNVL